LPPIILASQSPRRYELLKTLTSNFEVMVSEAEEIVDIEKSPIENVKDLAEKKVEWIEKSNRGRLVIGADTVVAFGDEILGKPKDQKDACRILRFLSGNFHQVITGVAAIGPGINNFVQVEVSTVQFKTLTEDQISDYVATGEPMDKAGAYAIQGKGGELIEFHNGSYSNIVGFPLEIVKPLLIRAGYLN
jgi:septum formation protein